MRVRIDWSDGVYSWREVNNDAVDAIEVPDDEIRLWESVNKIYEVIQRRLCRLVNEADEAREKARAESQQSEPGPTKFSVGDTVKINHPSGSYAVITYVHAEAPFSPADPQYYVVYHFGLDRLGKQITERGVVHTKQIVPVPREEFDRIANSPCGWSK